MWWSLPTRKTHQDKACCEWEAPDGGQGFSVISQPKIRQEVTPLFHFLEVLRNPTTDIQALESPKHKTYRASFPGMLEWKSGGSPAPISWSLHPDISVLAPFSISIEQPLCLWHCWRSGKKWTTTTSQGPQTSGPWLLVIEVVLAMSLFVT